MRASTGTMSIQAQLPWTFAEGGAVAEIDEAVGAIIRQFGL